MVDCVLAENNIIFFVSHRIMFNLDRQIYNLLIFRYRAKTVKL